MAWLAAKPKPDERSRRARMQVSPVSRLDKLKKEGKRLEMPPNPMPIVVNRLIEAGLFDRSGMGASPLTWCEIRAWAESAFVQLAPWESRLIRGLSVEYVNELAAAEDEHRPAPWRGEIANADRTAEEAGLRSLLG